MHRGEETREAWGGVESERYWSRLLVGEQWLGLAVCVLVADSLRTAGAPAKGQHVRDSKCSPLPIQSSVLAGLGKGHESGRSGSIQLTPKLDEPLRFIQDIYAKLGAAVDPGLLERETHVEVYLRLSEEARSISREIPPPADCPSWCDAHVTSVDVDPEGVFSMHSHRVGGNGWVLDPGSRPEPWGSHCSRTVGRILR